MNERTCLDLFTGLGCFSIAARSCGVRTVAMCEIKSDCRHFLAAQWPGVAVHDNIKTLDATKYREVWGVFGGPPCQPVSVAGAQLGEADHRWLWPQALRIVDECEPAFVLFENPPGFSRVGLDGVLAHLEAKGYATGTLNIPACGVDSAQRRERLWIMGHSESRYRRLQLQPRGPREASAEPARPVEDGALGYATKQSKRVPNLQALPDARTDARGVTLPATECAHVANSHSERCGGTVQPDGKAKQGRTEVDGSGESGALANGDSEHRDGRQHVQERGSLGRDADGRNPSLDLWQPATWIECGDGKRRRAKPGVCGVVNGPSVGLLEALGNAIVWPIAARIISAMIQAEEL